MIKLATEVPTFPAQESEYEQYSTAEMDLVSDDSFHAAEDDLPIALPLQHELYIRREGSPRSITKQAQARRPREALEHPVQQAIGQQQTTRAVPCVMVPMLAPRLLPPSPTTSRRTSPRAGQKHRRQPSDSIATHFDLRRSPTKMVEAYEKDLDIRAGSTRKRGNGTRRGALSGVKRSKRL
jgi:hypothetical protein